MAVYDPSLSPVRIPWYRSLFAALALDIVLLIIFLMVRGIIVTPHVGDDENVRWMHYVALTALGHFIALTVSVYVGWPSITRSPKLRNGLITLLVGFGLPHLLYRNAGSGISHLSCASNCVSTMLRDEYQTLASILTLAVVTLVTGYAIWRLKKWHRQPIRWNKPSAKR